MMASGSTMPGELDSIAQRARREALGTPDGWLAFGFGAGLARYAPGTVGTLAAVPLAVLLKWLGGAAMILLLPALFLLGVWLCARVTRRLGVEDYGGIVWDEMVGYWLAVAAVPLHWPWLLAGFVLFRFFDIVKPWPISLVEDQVSGGLGIMLDDVAAAIYTLVLLAGAEALFAAA